jgi:hypothetical protein
MSTVQPELKEEDNSLGGLGNIMLILGIGGYGIIGSILAKYNVTKISNQKPDQADPRVTNSDNSIRSGCLWAAAVQWPLDWGRDVRGATF